jgi:YfiH family protein
MRLPSPFKASDQQITIELPGGCALFSTRQGGTSTGPYSSMNLGAIAPVDGEPGVGDRASVVLANRKLLAEQIGLPTENFVHARQVHGNRVMRVHTSPTGAWSNPQGTRGLEGLPDADGQATALERVATVVLTADCLPVILIAEGAVASLHAGWRGLAAGVLEEGVLALRELGARGPVVAAIGPGARGCCYEVGPEVSEHFERHRSHALHGNRLDLAAVASAQLSALDVHEVHDCGLCTICSDRSLFFSHRRDQGLTGRQAGIAWRN